MWRTVPITVMVVLLAAVHHGSTETSFRQVTIYDGQFTLAIPEDWIEIDQVQLEELSMWAADATGGRLVEIYQYGFCPPEFEDDPLLPYMLVQIRESGRLRYGRFVHLAPLDEFQNDTRRTFPEGVPPLVAGVAVDRVAFDRAAYRIRLEHSLDLRVRGRVTVLTAAFLTERGLVTLHYADREKRIGRGRALFDEIVGSVVVAPELAYQPRLSDRWPGLPFFLAAAGVAAVLIGFLNYRRRQTS